VLFLYRPGQTWMPFALPRNRTDQAAYNHQLQQKFRSTKRVPPPVPTASGLQPTRDQREELRALHESGVLTDAEHEAALTRLGDGP
jgi:hypothetical protein